MSTKKIVISLVAILSLVAGPSLAFADQGSDDNTSGDDTTTEVTDTSDSTPTLVEAMAINSGGTSAKEAGDSVALKFSETTNKPDITAANVDDVFVLNNGHSFLDGASALGATTWSVDGQTLTINLLAGTSLATVDVGDTVTMAGDVIKDLDNNAVTGSATIEGSFTQTNDDGDNEDGDNDGEEAHHTCANTLINGQLYKIGTSTTVYLAANCRLKAFRGAAVFHARGLKFDEGIHILASLPAGVTISAKPVLPAEGTLVKGHDKTVWFVDQHGKRRGFVSANVFASLGFKFDDVDEIADTDLAELSTGDNVSTDTEHPDGALIKCGNSAAVFEVIGGAKFPFASFEAFTSRGHSSEHILNVDCGRFHYQQGAAVTATPAT